MNSSLILGESDPFDLADPLYLFILSTAECTDGIFTQPYLLNDCFRSECFMVIDPGLCFHESFAAEVFGFWKTGKQWLEIIKMEDQYNVLYNIYKNLLDSTCLVHLVSVCSFP